MADLARNEPNPTQKFLVVLNLLAELLENDEINIKHFSMKNFGKFTSHQTDRMSDILCDIVYRYVPYMSRVFDCKNSDSERNVSRILSSSFSYINDQNWAENRYYGIGYIKYADIFAFLILRITQTESYRHFLYRIPWYSSNFIPRKFEN